jgi:transcriptional regulator with XRE-family HTH domain
MRKSLLSDREAGICQRLRDARNRLGLTQESCAAQIGIERTTLANYEYKKAPLRAEAGIRFCRNLVVNEEWLATGAFKLTARVAKANGIPKPPAPEDPLWNIFFRHTVDLLAEPARNTLRIGALYSEAFDQMAGRYAQLISEHFHNPRIVASDNEPPWVTRNLFDAYWVRWEAILQNEAIRLKANPSLAVRSFGRTLIQTGQILFKRYMGFDTPEIQKDTYTYLRVIATDTKTPLGPLHGH